MKFRMREKLGIKQNISILDLKKFKMVNPDPNETKDIQVTPCPNEELTLKRLNELRVWLTLGFFSMILFTFMEIYYRRSAWDYLKVLLDFSLICTLLRAYMPNVDLKQVMFLPVFILELRMVIHLLFDFQFYFIKHIIQQNYE